MQVWLGQDGRGRGIVALDAITPEEFSEAFRRWEPTLKRIGPEEVADVVFEAMRPDVIAKVDGAGYQSVRFTVTAKRRRRGGSGVAQVALIKPMPVFM